MKNGVRIHHLYHNKRFFMLSRLLAAVKASVNAATFSWDNYVTINIAFVAHFLHSNE